MQEKSTRSPRRKTSVRQRRLPIDAAPPKVREHGLRDAHSRPLVSRGKIGRIFSGSFRVSPVQAWDFPSLEIRAANTWPALILDLDGWLGHGRLMLALQADSLPTVNWVVERRGGGSHAVWTLARPVHRGATAREKPLKLLGRISEYYAFVLQADEGYAGVLTHNPMEPAQGPDFRTHWWRREPHGLRELAEIIPFGWRKPKSAATAVGRNCDIFAHCMRWAGSPGNLGAPVLEEAMAVNDGLKFPLGTSEVAGIARSVESYRRKWIQQGQFWGSGKSSYDHSSEAQAKRGKRSGQVRRKRTKERDRAIIRAVTAGQSMRSVAREYGLHHRTVEKIVRREAPLFARSAPLTETRPWEAEGISRAQWYRRDETSGDRT